jgi:Predicted transcriptional regulators
MQRALSELEAGGLLTTQRTAGRTVTDDRNAISAARNVVAKKLAEDFAAKMTGLGLSQNETKKYMEEAFLK